MVDALFFCRVDFFEGEGLVGDACALVEFSHELDPMETHSVQEHFKRIHQKQDQHDGQHEWEPHNEKVRDVSKPVLKILPWIEHLRNSVAEEEECVTKLTVSE